jgi:rubrerythrin
MLRALENLRIRLVVRLLWSSPQRIADAARGFQATEADGVWHLHRSLQRTSDPKQRAILFTHSLEEESHAESFGKLVATYATRTASPPSYEREDLHGPSAALWKTLAYVHVGEEDATDRFRMIEAALPAGPFKEALAQIVRDESTHVDLTHDMLVKLGARDAEIRNEVLKVRLARLWENWLRSGKRIVDVVATLLLSIAYASFGLFLTGAARRRLASRLVGYDNNRLKSLT